MVSAGAGSRIAVWGADWTLQRWFDTTEAGVMQPSDGLLLEHRNKYLNCISGVGTPRVQRTASVWRRRWDDPCLDLNIAWFPSLLIIAITIIQINAYYNYLYYIYICAASFLENFEMSSVQSA